MKQITLLFMLALLSIFQAMAQESDYLPLVREGVIWVNEKVIVNHGDTTRYYYKYEISGKDSLDIDQHGYAFNACYYYTGHELNTEMDSLIAGLSYDSNNSMHRVFCYRNDPYYINKWEGKFLFILGGLMTPYIPMLYNFKDCPEYYMFAANEIDDESPILTEDNFKEIDPVVIEGIACRRYAYTSEEGTPLAYVVEGIGFDSYDMGDLLTPFTKRPDPNADYQEWCGLSHVIKDGQIIYKGMRYRPDVLEGIDEVVADKTCRPLDENYYDLMGRKVGKDIPTVPGIYIHQGKKICVSRMP